MAGVALIVAVILGYFSFAGEDEDFSEVAQGAFFQFTSGYFLLAIFIMVLALVSVHARQAEAAGGLGWAGFALALLGGMMVFGAMWAQAFVAPWAATEAPQLIDQDPGGTLAVGFLLSFGVVFLLGWLLFGIAILRAKVYPKAPAILFIIGALGSVVPWLPIGPILVGAGLVWIGIVTKDGAAAPPTPGEPATPVEA